MQKKLHRKLNLSRETLRTLTPSDLDGAHGGGTATTVRSTPTDTCATSCFACNLTNNCAPSVDTAC